MNYASFPAPQVETVIPTGPALVGVVNTAVTDSFRQNTPPFITLPSLWRLAYHVTREAGPLTIYRYQEVSP